MNKLLTIGMSTYDDFDGVYFSIQSLRLHHDINDEIELLIIDNNPDQAHGKCIRDLSNWINNLKYIKYTNKKSTAARNEIFRNASGKYCISMDCHVLFAKNSLTNLLNYYSSHENCKDIVQGPMMYDDLKNYATHFKPTWGGDMYGQWDTNHEAYQRGEPFDIPMMGLGVFSCETKNWLGFNENFKGFGGEEGYIHEKFRLNGGRSICLPGFKWLHRFGRPAGVKYPLILEDRIWNYFVGWLELTQDPNHNMIQDIYNNFQNRIPKNSLDNIFNQAKKLILNPNNNGE